MIQFAKIYYFIFAALTAAGGILGFVKANSKPSLIAGIISGILLAISGGLIPFKPLPGSILGLVVSLLLLGRFLPAYLKKGATMPAVPMILLSVIAIALSIATLVRR